jgi:hypothetical protein
MYRERMMGYYPEVIRAIEEFKAIIYSEYPEIEGINNANESVISDAYLTTIGEERITQWENMLGIAPIEGSSVDDRRDTVIARIRGQGKLNSQLINTIVKTFTGGTANSWIKDSVLYVEITPPPGNKTFLFENVEQELRNKVPSHLGFQVSRNYYSWAEVQNKYSTWQQVKDNFAEWTDVLLFSPFAVRRTVTVIIKTNGFIADYAIGSGVNTSPNIRIDQDTAIELSGNEVLSIYSDSYAIVSDDSGVLKRVDDDADNKYPMFAAYVINPEVDGDTFTIELMY